MDKKVEIIVLGAGPGGYAAAFYAAAKGKKVVLVDKGARLGGVCLNRGCIPSKALLHASKLILEARDSDFRGISFAKPKIDLDKMRSWKESIIEKLAQGVSGLAKRRNVEVIKGKGYFEDSHTLRVETEKGQDYIHFDHAIIASGSVPALPAAFDLGSKKVMTSTEALELEEIPKNLLVIGGGYIGMELGTVYATLGSQVTLVEALSSLLTGADPDLVRPVKDYAQKHFKELRLGAKVKKMATYKNKIRVEMDFDGKTLSENFDRVLVSVGRIPNCEDMGIENTKIERDEKGFIKVDKTQKTAEPLIYAIGDVVGGAMLAHKASKEARIAIEVICGEVSVFEDIIIPAVVFTDPEVAWCGLTEAEAKEKGITVKVSKFPWAASGRALSVDRTDGLTKLIVEPETERVLGVGIVGVNAGDLISEGVLAIEMGATVKDMADSVHPHPTLSETLMESAEAFYGHSAHTVSKNLSE